ncbi:hypothetical protein PQO00_17060 [Flavivirga sp. 57AJ16]|nr:hypothetical protein [Flavivirga sp. 57AJ16]
MNRLLYKNLIFSNNAPAEIEQTIAERHISYVNFMHTSETFSYFNEILYQQAVHVIYPGVGMNIIEHRNRYKNHLLCNDEERVVFINKVSYCI